MNSQCSLSISQLSIELSAKTYGGGILKIEPSAAKNILVFSGNMNKFPTKFEQMINGLLAKGRRDEIIDSVDNWFIGNFDLPEKTYDEIKKSYREIRKIRQSESFNVMIISSHFPILVVRNS